jgi:hypothetical protein
MYHALANGSMMDMSACKIFSSSFILANNTFFLGGISVGGEELARGAAAATAVRARA